MRAFVHDVVNPIAAIRISAGALRARAALTDRELADLGRIEQAAGMIIQLVTSLGPVRREGRADAPGEAGPTAAVDLYVLCCELAAARRLAGGASIHCRAVGDPRGDWDRRQVTQLLSGLLDHAIEHLGRGAPITIAVTGMARHVRVDVHGLGLLSRQRRQASLDVSSRLGASPAGTTVTVIAGRSGVVFRLRLPRQAPSVSKGVREITRRSGKR